LISAARDAKFEKAVAGSHPCCGLLPCKSKQSTNQYETEASGFGAGLQMKVTYREIYEVIVRIPRRRVSTYGQIAELAGIPGQPRRIGYALSALNGESGVPWHRVVNAKGMISSRSDGRPDLRQRRLLQQEGIVFDRSGRIDLARFQWRPRF